jgi:hypothetical protein
MHARFVGRGRGEEWRTDVGDEGRGEGREWGGAGGRNGECVVGVPTAAVQCLWAGTDRQEIRCSGDAFNWEMVPINPQHATLTDRCGRGVGPAGQGQQHQQEGGGGGEQQRQRRWRQRPAAARNARVGHLKLSLACWTCLWVRKEGSVREPPVFSRVPLLVHAVNFDFEGRRKRSQSLSRDLPASLRCRRKAWLPLLGLHRCIDFIRRTARVQADDPLQRQESDPMCCYICGTCRR